jgi:tetratricopeptide (TPR) repeat protein
MGIALAGSAHELESDRLALFDELSSDSPIEGTRDELRAALLHHPSEPYIPFIGAVAEARQGRSVLPWIERTLSLAPVYGPAHYVLAQQLAARSPAQARLEYRLALSQAYWTLPVRDGAIRHGAELVKNFDDALELIPDSRYRWSVMEQVASSVATRLPATRVRLDELILKADPMAQGAISRGIQDVTADLVADDAAPWCEDHSVCVEPAAAAATRLLSTAPWRCDFAVQRARLGVAAGDAPLALRELQEEAFVAADPVSCWRALGDLALSTGTDAYVNAAEEAMVRSGCADNECAGNLLWVASLEQQRGNPRRALTYYQRAHDKAPERVDLVERMADLASTLGFHAQALEAYRTLASMSPDPRWRDGVTRERTELMREATRGAPGR